VNGLIRKLADPDFIEYISDYKLLLFTETWLSPHTHYNLQLNGFCSEHLFGNKSTRVRKGRYSGGVSIYYKCDLKSNIQVIEKLQCGIIWLKMCKDLFNFGNDVYICIAYVPPIDSKIHNTNDINMFECIESGIEKYKEHGHIYVTGDFNARTANLPDFLERDRFLDTNIELDYINLPERVNKDHVIDAHGRRLVYLCKTTNLFIGNGRLDEDEHFIFTFYNNNGASTVDYLLIQFNNLKHITSFKIKPPNEFSGHCPICFCINRKPAQLISRDDAPTH